MHTLGPSDIHFLGVVREKHAEFCFFFCFLTRKTISVDGILRSNVAHKLDIFTLCKGCAEAPSSVVIRMYIGAQVDNGRAEV